MDSYKFELWAHIIAVVIGLGVTFSLPFLQAFAERTSVGATRFALRFALRLDNFVILPGSVLLFIFGGLLIGNDVTGYKDDMPTWLIIAIIWFVALIAVDLLVLRRIIHRAIAALDAVPDNGTLPDAYTPLSRQVQMVGGLLGISIIAIAFLMVWKPGQ